MKSFVAISLTQKGRVYQTTFYIDRVNVEPFLPPESMKPIDLTILQPPTSPRPPETPPSSPSMAPCEQVLTLKHVQHFLDLLKVFQVTQSLQSLRENSVSSDAIETSGGQQHVASRGSKLEFKLINEVSVREGFRSA